jgi:hypothetical protein
MPERWVPFTASTRVVAGFGGAVVVVAGTVVVVAGTVEVDESVVGAVTDVLGTVVGASAVAGGSTVWSTELGRPATATPARSPTNTVAMRGIDERFIRWRH